MSFFFKLLFASIFIVAGVLHFVFPDSFESIVPPYLPAPRLLVLISGAFELILGASLLVPKSQHLAAWGLIALLIAVFPANLHMTLYPDQFSQFPQWLLWLRLPLQAVLIGWAYSYTRI